MTIRDKYAECRRMPRGTSQQIEQAITHFSQLLVDVEKILIDVGAPTWRDTVQLRNLIIDEITTLKQMLGHSRSGSNPYGRELPLRLINPQIKKRYDQ